MRFTKRILNNIRGKDAARCKPKERHGQKLPPRYRSPESCTLRSGYLNFTLSTLNFQLKKPSFL